MKTSISRRAFLGSTSACVGAAAAAEAAEAKGPSQDTTMPLRPLGKLGWMVSIVGFGGGSRFLIQKDLEEVERMIDRAIERGIRYFDTAHAYRDNETGIRESQRRYGRYLTPKYRKQITLATKLGARDAETAKQQFEEALEDLKTDHVEVLHFHGIGSTEDTDQIVAKGGALEVFRKWKKEGVVRAIGVTSHHDAEVLLDALKRIEPDCVMCPLNPAHDRAIRDGVSFAQIVMPYALEHGIGMLAMKSTGRESLIGKGGITAEELVRYALALPIAAAVIGMPTTQIVQSNARIARTLKPMTDEERGKVNRRLAKAGAAGTLPYLAAGYTDGERLA